MNSAQLRILVRRGGGTSTGFGRLASMLRFTNPACPLSELHSKINSDASMRQPFFDTFTAFTYDRGTEITFGDAVEIGGEDRVRKAALASAMLTTRPVMDEQLVFDIDTYRRRCVTTAVLLESLAQRYKQDYAEWAFYTGLLMDAGYLVMIDHMAADFQHAMFMNTSTKDEDVLVTENRQMGMDHSEVGAVIAEEFGFQQVVVCGVAYHHRPLEAPEDQRYWASLCHLASWLVDNLGLRVAENMPAQSLVQEAFDEIKMDPDYKDHISSSVRFAAGVCDTAVAFLSKRVA